MTADILYFCENDSMFARKTSVYIQNFKKAYEKQLVFYGKGQKRSLNIQKKELTELDRENSGQKARRNRPT